MLYNLREKLVLIEMSGHIKSKFLSIVDYLKIKLVFNIPIHLYSFDRVYKNNIKWNELVMLALPCMY